MALHPAAVEDEADGGADDAAERGEDRPVLPLPAGHRVARLRSTIALHFDRQRPNLDLGTLRPGHVADEPAHDETDDEQDSLAVHAASAASCLARSTAVSMVPTM